MDSITPNQHAGIKGWLMVLAVFLYASAVFLALMFYIGEGSALLFGAFGGFSDPLVCFMGVMYLVTITFLLLPINKRVQLSVSLFLIAYTLGSWVYAIAGDFDYFKTYFFEELMAYGVLSFDLTTLVIVLMGVYLLVIGLFSTRISLRTVRWSSAIVSGLVLFFLTFYTYDLEWFDWVYLALLFFVIKVILLMHNHSKKFVKVATICMGVLSLAFLTEAIYFVYGNMVWSGSSNYDLDFILYTLRGLIPFFFVAVASLFSLLYLKKSQRVKNTFVKD